MSFIDTIEIKNFKSIRHQKIEGCKRVNLLIGHPNVGKSNILEAVSLISYFKKESYVPIKQLCRFKELIDLFNDGDKQKDAEIVADKYVFVLRFIDKNQVGFGVFNKTGYLQNRNLPLSEGLKHIQIRKDGTSGNAGRKDYDDSHISVKKYDFHLPNETSHSNPTVLDFPYGENLAEVIRYNNSLRKEFGELFSLYNLKLIFDENNNIIIQKQLDEFTAFQFSFFQVADTLQRLIFHKAAIATNENTILLFEEPEAHMFPPYISKFTSDISHDENKNQFFITTHSPFVLNDLMDNLKSDELAIYIVSYKKEAGETLIHRMSEEDMHEAYQFGYDFFMNIDRFITEAQHE